MGDGLGFGLAGTLSEIEAQSDLDHSVFVLVHSDLPSACCLIIIDGLF